MFERVLFFAGALLVALTPTALRAQSCENLAKLSSPTVSITAAKTINGGSFTPSGSKQALSSLPAFCLITATLRPTSDSDIQTAIWLPIANWNGKFVAIGNGGWGGAIGGEAYEDMADALRRGYATSATDDGHTDHGGAFTMGHPEKFIDFAYRAEHDMTVEAKSLIKAFYGRDAHYSYWNGCSGGGREGLLQAHRYPDEFDGVIAGDPANINRNTWALWLAVHTFKDPAAYIPPAKYPMIHRAVLEACDANDGVKDGLIENPEKCRVDFKVLQCKGADGPECLTERQIQTAQTIISPATDSAGSVVFPRLEPGTELRWARVAGGPAPADLFLDQFRYIVYRDPAWDWRTFDIDRDSEKAKAIDKDVDELDPRLTEFAKRGGKLLIYHGWADQQVAPGSSVEFYKAAVSASENPHESAKWIRLFMVPGMAHCSGGEGPDTFDKLSVMERWVEKGEAPDRIVASRSQGGRVDRSRPLCPYPQVAIYKGSGSIDDAANFVCRLPQ
jgi:feruloyl esterase